MPLKLYHYTDSHGKTGIEKTGTLKASAGGACGPGVYTTCLHPTNLTKRQIIENNSCRGADWVVELDTRALQADSWDINKCNNGYRIKNGDHYLVTKGVTISKGHGGFARASGGYSRGVGRDGNYRTTIATFVRCSKCFPLLVVCVLRVPFV